jgi:multidrug resistance protein, MATE family
MNNGFMPRFIAQIIHDQEGESYWRIIRYFIPEFITAFLLYSLPYLLDAYFIGSLQSTTTYATVGLTGTLIHLLIKVSEGVLVGTIVLCGNFNGMGDFKDVGRSLRDAFWLNIIIGSAFTLILYAGAPWYYAWYDVSEKMILLGVPFLRMKAISLFFMFVAASFFGFMRGIKNTKVPMAIYIAGSLTFILFDWLLIFGNGGFEPMGMQGSAVASVIQYVVMTICAIAYVFLNPHNRMYGIELFTVFTDKSWARRLLALSVPVMIDKATVALTYIWLGKMLCIMGKQGAAAFSVIKDLERLSILPALAFAQIVTLLVSNDYGGHNWTGIKANIKKILLLTTCMVVVMVLFLAFFTESVVQLFDKKDKFTQLASFAFPFLGVLVFFDVLQLVLAGALRATGNVRLVMVVRVAVFTCFFLPVSYVLAQLDIAHQGVHFVLIYGTFYVGCAIMSLIFINRFRGQKWKTKII